MSASISSISHSAINLHPSWMDAKTNRRNNLAKLVEEFGSQAALGKKTDVDAAYISQVLTGWQGRGLGAKVARQIEDKLQHPRGWMDQDHSAAKTATASIGEKVSIYGHLVDRETADIAAELEKLEPHERKAIGEVIYLMVGRKKRTERKSARSPRTRSPEPRARA